MAEYFNAETIGKTRYMPSAEETKARSLAYGYLQDMIDLKNEPFPHFSGPEGQRSWLQLINDSESILNGYTISRDAQGKEAWQSNMMDNISRVKVRAVVAGVGLKVPDMAFVALNKTGLLSSKRAEIFKNIVKQTFKDGNPSLHSFLEVWHMLSHGMVVVYEGFKTGGAKREKVVSFDTRTGEVETKTEYIHGNGKPFSVLLNPQEFYWHDMKIRDVQDQPRIAWVQHYTKAECQQEFEKYPNYKFIKDKTGAAKFLPLQDTLFFDSWSSRVDDEDDFEVIRIYSKADNLDDDSPCYGYEVWVNGVPMLRAPLLWGQDEPMYPFAHQIAEPYANTNFFVGVPFGQIVEAYKEQKNTVVNTMIDKLYRSMKKPYLVGLGNKDILEFEGKFVDEDNRFYVPDISQVKPFPYEGLNTGEFQMLSVLDRGIDSLSVDKAQQGQVQGGAKTAREVVIANQRAQEMKGILFLALEDLWYQKTKLRTQVVLTHYISDKAMQTYMKDQIIQIPDYTFGDGVRGILAIHVAKSKGKLLSQMEIEAREQTMEEQGIPYKLVSIKDTYLDEWQYDFKIVPQSLRDEQKAEDEEELMKEIQTLTTLYPEFYLANKDRYLGEILALRGKHPSEFNPPLPPPPIAPETPQDAPGAPVPSEQPLQSHDRLAGLFQQLNQ